MAIDFDDIIRNAGRDLFETWRSRAVNLYDEQSNVNERSAPQGTRANPQRSRTTFINDYIGMEYAAHQAARHAAVLSSPDAYLQGVDSSVE